MTQSVILLLLIIPLLQQATPTQPYARQLHLRLVNAADQPLTDETVRLTVYHRNIHDTCHTDANGRCTFTFDANIDLVRGSLQIVGRGTRPVIWRGPNLELTLVIQNMTVDIPVDFARDTSTDGRLPATTPTIAPKPVDAVEESGAVDAQTHHDHSHSTFLVSPTVTIPVTSVAVVSADAADSPTTDGVRIGVFLIAFAALVLFFAVLWAALQHLSRGGRLR